MSATETCEEAEALSNLKSAPPTLSTSITLENLASEQHRPRTFAIRRVKAQHLGHIVIIELQRPTVKNAISSQMLSELEKVFEELHLEAQSNEARAVIVASSLNDVFCAGADLKERARGSTADARAFLDHARRVFSLLTALPIPTIACVSGSALGGGLELALCCHLRVFSTNAKVSLPETRLGIIPGAGGTFRLPEVIGWSNALDLILTGRRVEIEEALRMGLCNRLVRPDDGGPGELGGLRELTLAAGISLAQDIAAGAPLATKAALGAVAGASEMAEDVAYNSVLVSEDRNRALRHFAQKGPSLAFVGR